MSSENSSWIHFKIEFILALFFDIFILFLHNTEEEEKNLHIVKSRLGSFGPRGGSDLENVVFARKLMTWCSCSSILIFQNSEMINGLESKVQIRKNIRSCNTNENKKQVSKYVHTYLIEKQK